MKIELIHGDITTVEIDAIVNAANTSLLDGSGVDGAIHKAGGKQILQDCRSIRNRQGGCKTGEAVITRAGKLKAKHIIHTVGPVYNGENLATEVLLEACYKNSINLLLEKGLQTIAFPNISTGIYKFPKKKAAEIAIKSVNSFEKNEQLKLVLFVCFDKDNYTIYKELLSK